MTVLPRGAKSRRGGRRPGWLMLTALLVLAILASVTLVFTSRVELLRLAVILSLWAAVLAAFVSVIYRRQSELDSAKARDMKFVYDLQLDREISARREYELSVEAHLRRQLAGELRAQASDEMAALRTELATLRANLQALLGTDLGDRPALGFDRAAEIPGADPRAMPMPPPPGRVESSRVTPADGDQVEVTQIQVTHVEMAQVEVAQVVEELQPAELESPIIDVPEEPLTPPAPEPAPVPPPARAPRARAPHRPQPAEYRPPAPAPDYRGSHRRGAGDVGWAPPATRPPAPAAARPPVQPVAPTSPVPFPPAAQVPFPPTAQVPFPPTSQVPFPPTSPWRPPETKTRPGRHRTTEEPAAQDAPTPAPAPPGRHRNADESEPVEPQGQHSGGAPVADLMARLRSDEVAGETPAAAKGDRGGRRRRKD